MTGRGEWQSASATEPAVKREIKQKSSGRQGGPQAKTRRERNPKEDKAFISNIIICCGTDQQPHLQLPETQLWVNYNEAVIQPNGD